MAQPKAGGAFKYNGTDPIGSDSGALVPGTKVTVREIVPAGVKGAHDDTEDAAVIEWEAPALVQGENGAEVGYVTRAMSIGVASFTANFVGA